MKKIMKFIVFIGFAFLMIACSDDNSTTTPTVVSVTGVSLNKKTLSMTVGGTETLSVVVSPTDATNKRVAWSSSKAEVASVDNQGVVTAHKAGDAVVTVKSEDGGKTDACNVTVTAQTVAVTSVKLDKSEATLTVGGTVTLVATVAPENATNKKMTWKSDKTDIATVDANGKVTAIKAGTATITVTTEDGNKTATCKVTVQAAEVKVTGVKLNKTEVTLTEGGTFQFVATVAPTNATNKKVTWKSSNTDVVDIDSGGLAGALKAGTATITATTEDGNFKAYCSVTVQSASIAVKSVSLNKVETKLYVGGTETLIATISPDNATNKAVTWSSSKSSVASVDKDGTISAKSVGTATITVTTDDGKLTANCSVTVEAMPSNNISGKGYENLGTW